MSKNIRCVLTKNNKNYYYDLTTGKRIKEPKIKTGIECVPSSTKRKSEKKKKKKITKKVILKLEETKPISKRRKVKRISKSPDVTKKKILKPSEQKVLSPLRLSPGKKKLSPEQKALSPLRLSPGKKKLSPDVKPKTKAPIKKSSPLRIEGVSPYKKFVHLWRFAYYKGILVPVYDFGRFQEKIFKTKNYVEGTLIPWYRDWLKENKLKDRDEEGLMYVDNIEINGYINDLYKRKSWEIWKIGSEARNIYEIKVFPHVKRLTKGNRTWSKWFQETLSEAEEFATIKD